MKTLKFVLLPLCILMFSCEDTGNNQDDQEVNAILADVKVRPEFEQKPPIAEDVSIELLEQPTSSDENVRLTATFSKEDVERIKESFLAIQIGKEQVVLRDDGKGADEKEGDGIFSLFLKEDIGQLIKDLEGAKEEMLLGKRKHFSNARSITQLDQKRLGLFEPSDLKSKKRLKIPSTLFPFTFGPKSVSFPILAEKSLLVNSIGVVEDPTRTFNPCDFSAAAGNPNGVWTFGELMRQMASPSPGSIVNDATTINFVMDWLNTWTIPNTVNGDGVPPRNIASVINTWQTLSDQANIAAGNPVGPLLLERLPFKLTAIVNRLDLRGSSGYGFSDAGEGRLVFCVLDNACNPREFNVIFEYGINKKTCVDVKAFGQEWAELSNPTLTLGSPAYNAALEAITMQFTQCGTNTSKPNDNSINQIRTNEIAIGAPWELREFNLNAAGVLEMVDVKMEPARKYNQKNGTPETQLLASYVNGNEPDILANNYEIPLSFSGSDFRGGAAHTQFPPVGNVNVAGNNPSHFDAATTAPFLINNDDARHILSLNTCSGCHGGETQTSFTHIDPAGFGSPAGLSGFLTGSPGRSVGGVTPVDADGLSNGTMSVFDPAGRPSGGPAVMRGFNDLQRRVGDLDDLINQNCVSKSAISIANKLNFRPLVMTH